MKKIRIFLKNSNFHANSVDLDGNTALTIASSKGNYQVVKILLDCGTDVSLKDALGKTAYDYAVEYNHSEIIELLSN